MADYISREAVINEFCDDCVDREWCKITGYSCSRINNINAIPAADVRPVEKARWEGETGYIFSERTESCYCPVCRSFSYFGPLTRRNFCPNCGAHMRGGK